MGGRGRGAVGEVESWDHLGPQVGGENTRVCADLSGPFALYGGRRYHRILSRGVTGSNSCIIRTPLSQTDYRNQGQKQGACQGASAGTGDGDSNQGGSSEGGQEHPVAGFVLK